MKKISIFIVLVIVSVMILTACTNQNAVETEDLITTNPASSLVGNTEKSTVSESTTVDDENTAEKIESTSQKSTVSSTTEKASTTAKQTTTTTKKHTTTTTTTKRVTTTQKQTSTQKPSATHKATTTKPTTTKAKTTKHKHGAPCGNMGKWYSLQSELKNDYMRVSDKWLAKYDNGEIDWDTYVKNCPCGYECWSCGECGKWTGNYKY